MTTAHPARPTSAFTMTELIMVVIIIGVLAAVALPSFRIQMLKMKNQEAIRVLTAIWEAERDYYRENGDYTGDLNELAVDIPPMKNFQNLVLTNVPGSVCGGPVVTNRARLDSMDSSYRLYLKEDGTIWCCSLPVCNCPGSICLQMGFPAQYW